jgi:UrcA family protein
MKNTGFLSVWPRIECGQAAILAFGETVPCDNQPREFIMNSISKIIITGAIAAVSTTAALAQSDAPRAAVVQYADLDLSSEAGQKALKLRIKRAAVAVCTNGNEHLSLGAQNKFSKCRDAAVAKALASLGGKKSTDIAVATASE